jgi:Mrp family chromosome partitioning ATPase
LEEYLRLTIPLSRAVQATSMTGVDVLGASHGLDGSPELPGRARFRELWSEARSYDFVIVDAGPVNAFSEVAGVASQADATILVLDERGSELRQVVAARRTLENHDIKILGIVVNRSHAASARIQKQGSILGVLGGSNGRKDVVGVG